MSCPRCNHTMQCLFNEPHRSKHFWCPRCGTIKRVDPTGWEDIATPRWIDRLCLLVSDDDGAVREANTPQEAINAYVWGCAERNIQQLLK